MLVLARARGRRARLRGPFRRPVLVAAARRRGAVGGLVAAAPLPLGGDRARALGRRRPLDAGLGRLARATSPRRRAIGAVFAGVGAAAARRADAPLPARAGGSPARRVVVAFAAVTIYAGPGRPRPDLQPLHRLPHGPDAQRRAGARARGAGVDVGEVYEVDASRRTTASNAYVTGLGRTKRVVLYDNLLKDFTRDEVRLVVAHELGHVHYRDVPRGLLYVALVAPVGAVRRRRLTRAPGAATSRGPGPAALPGARAVGRGRRASASRSSPTSSRGASRRAPTATRCGSPTRPSRSSASSAASRCATSPIPTRRTGSSFLLATHPPTVDRIGIARRSRRRDAEQRSSDRYSSSSSGVPVVLGQVLMPSRVRWSSCPPWRRAARA